MGLKKVWRAFDEKAGPYLFIPVDPRPRALCGETEADGENFGEKIFLLPLDGRWGIS